MAIDIKIVETGNGGDMEFTGNDIAIVEGIENMPYLANFGGNVEGDWWGNSLFLKNDPDRQFASETEKVLTQVALNSSGRLKIEQAIKNDLSFLTTQFPDAVITVSGVITAPDLIELSIDINGVQVAYLWNPKNEQLTPL